VTNFTLNTYPLDTYLLSVPVSGTRDTDITQIFINDSDAQTTYPEANTWAAAATFTTFGSKLFTFYGKYGNGVPTAPITISINRHTIGDINGDGVVTLADASLFAVDWNKTSNLQYPLSDMNNGGAGDGIVDLTDFSVLASLIQ
jgi:hypothetical protein